MYFDGYGYRRASFEQIYRCYPASLIDKKPQIENGDKVILPCSALHRLVSLNIDYPMVFELRNDAAERVSHCGVLEFIADEGMIYMPNWMMENLSLQEGDLVRVRNAALPKGTYVKLQPHTKDLLDISNPKAITLRNFSCLTTGDSIMVAYNNKKYYIDIVETKPSNAVSVIETDCEVDFAPPLDYMETERPSQPIPTTSVQDVPKFNPFMGSGKRMDGKPSENHPSTQSWGSQDKKTNASTLGSGSSSSQTRNRQSQGKLVFGSNTSRTQEMKKHTLKEANQEAPKKEETKFQPFTGNKYSLKP